MSSSLLSFFLFFFTFFFLENIWRKLIDFRCTHLWDNYGVERKLHFTVLLWQKQELFIVIVISAKCDVQCNRSVIFKSGYRIVSVSQPAVYPWTTLFSFLLLLLNQTWPLRKYESCPHTLSLHFLAIEIELHSGALTLTLDLSSLTWNLILLPTHLRTPFSSLALEL